MVYQNTNFKICLGLFGCEVNILPKQHIVQWGRCGYNVVEWRDTSHDALVVVEDGNDDDDDEERRLMT